MAKTLRLILGDQLNHQHSWFSRSDDEVTYIIMEMRQETDYVIHHIQKVVAFFSAMRQFASWLKRKGHKVIYFKLDHQDNSQDLTKNIIKVIQEHDFDRFEYLLPDEYRLDKQLRDLCSEIDIDSQALDTEHFITKREDLSNFFGDKNYLMESFYRHIRRKHGWLMEGKVPTGGSWNYDKQNRKSLPKHHVVVDAYTFQNDVSEICALIQQEDIETLGGINEKNFLWPTNRSQSLMLLRYFLKNCLADFGNFQDAMHTDYWSLYHSRLSFAINAKLLSPLEVVERAISQFHADDEVEIAAVEGFIRQIVGWREFMRGVYWAKMPEYAEQNQLNHRRQLPKWFWNGKTKMNCLKHAIDQSLQYAYAHHIQRLMITGNFALLAQIHPDEVDAWYLGIYIDAIEWVEMPNARGMSQFADGGIVATKPYVSSANYINKMSNYCTDCHYHPKKKIGDQACPFNSLYWHFLMHHENKFARNGRMNMMYSQLNKMSSEQKEQLNAQAEKYLQDIDSL